MHSRIQDQSNMILKIYENDKSIYTEINTCSIFKIIYKEINYMNMHRVYQHCSINSYHPTNFRIIERNITSFEEKKHAN